LNHHNARIAIIQQREEYNSSPQKKKVIDKVKREPIHGTDPPLTR